MFPRLYLPLILVCITSGYAQEPLSQLPADVVLQIQELQELQQKHRYVEAVTKLDELQAKYPDRPEFHNIRGSLYMSPALRDLDKAGECFDKALKLSPNELPPHFNKAELLLVKHDWVSAGAAFQQVLQKFPKLPLQVRHVVLFKLLVCEVKQDKIADAEKTLADHFTFMDDTPAYYFSKSAVAFQKKDESSAHDWIKRANGIFKQEEIAPYFDTLMEVRWVPNIGLPESPKSE